MFKNLKKRFNMTEQRSGGVEAEKQVATFKQLYGVGPELGCGSFGRVYAVQHLRSDEWCAVKVTRAPKPKEDKKDDDADGAKTDEQKRKEKKSNAVTSELAAEFALVKKLTHENILEVYDYMQEEGLCYMIMEQCEGGDVFEKLRAQRQFSEQEAANLLVQMLDAICYLHMNGIAHRDVKAENFMFEEKENGSSRERGGGKVKLIDFGFATRLENLPLTEIVGSPHYLAPDVLKRKYDEAVDLWALGVLSYLMIIGRYPFDAAKRADLFKKIKNFEYDQNRAKNLSSTAYAFVFGLINKDPAKRMRGMEAARHEFLLEKATRRASVMSTMSPVSGSLLREGAAESGDLGSGKAMV